MFLQPELNDLARFREGEAPAEPSEKPRLSTAPAARQEPRPPEITKQYLGRGRPACPSAGETPTPQASPSETAARSSARRQPFLCFQRRSPGDVLVGKTKIAGSAQRRSSGAVLQHGSVLLARSPAAPELDGLKELSGRTIAPEQLAQAWLASLASAVPGTWQRGMLSDDQRRRASTLAAEKYSSAAWVENRGRGG
jgi:hypothetical protein